VRIGLGINYAGGFKDVAAEVADLERAGLDIVFVPEAYSFDAVSALGYLAASTARWLASGILRLYTRTPTLTAMTAAALDCVPTAGYARPRRLCPGSSRASTVCPTTPRSAAPAVIDICRQVWRRRSVKHQASTTHDPHPQARAPTLANRSNNQSAVGRIRCW
jgi:alkanesulfonate monooxygenase SsuD/methylene tetrahydromethanopterin reductase-like flavin-dependent oxidoreductase (luciferase family)